MNYRQKEERLWNYLKENNIDFTEIQTNSVDDDCFDFYIKGDDFLLHENNLRCFTGNQIICSPICGIIFYSFPDSFYRY